MKQGKFHKIEIISLVSARNKIDGIKKANTVLIQIGSRSSKRILNNRRMTKWWCPFNIWNGFQSAKDCGRFILFSWPSSGSEFLPKHFVGLWEKVLMKSLQTMKQYFLVIVFNFRKRKTNSSQFGSARDNAQSDTLTDCPQSSRETSLLPPHSLLPTIQW